MHLGTGLTLMVASYLRSGMRGNRVSNPRSLDTSELVAPLVLRTLPGSGAAGAGVVLGTGAACFLAQWTSVMLWVGPAQVSTVWLPGGLMLAIALLTEPRRWPAVLTAAG